MFYLYSHSCLAWAFEKLKLLSSGYIWCTLCITTFLEKQDPIKCNSGKSYNIGIALATRGICNEMMIYQNGTVP